MDNGYWKVDMKNLSLISLLLIPCLTGCFLKKNDTVLAHFNALTVKQSEFVSKIQRLPSEIRSVAIRRKREFLEQMVDETLLEREAKRRGIHRLPDVKDVIEAAHRKILIAKLIELEVDKRIHLEKEEATQFYEAHKEEFMTPPLYRASHILVRTQDEANNIKAELTKGADFEELARKHSADNTALRGGDIGFFQKGQLIPEFEEMAFKMKKGQISPVFKTQFGYHILKLTDSAEPALREFNSVRLAVEKQLLNEKRSQAYRDFLKKLRGSQKIDVDEKALDAVNV